MPIAPVGVGKRFHSKPEKGKQLNLIIPPYSTWLLDVETGEFLLKYAL